jgi:hypothetical protein
MADKALTASGPQQRFGVMELAGLAIPIIAMVVGYFLNPVATLRSYLWAFLYVVSIPVGALAVLMLQHLTGGGWGVILRRPLEAATRTLPLVAIMFLPIGLGATKLFPWAEPGAFVPHPRDLYLNLPFFGIRAAIYFGVWLTMAWALNRWSAQQDIANPPGFDRRFRLLSGPGLGLMGLTVTFASIDWSMSLEQNWFSSIYGVLFGVGMVLSAFTLGIIVVVLLSDQRPYRSVLAAGHLRDLGSLTLAFVMVWAYLSISQFLLMWSANLQEEAPYFIARSQHGWQYVISVVVFCMFVLPFVVLLTRDGKRNTRSLGFIAGLILFMRWLELYWLVAPGRPVHGHTVFWTDLFAPLALGGPWLACFLFELNRRPLLPVNADPSVAGDHHG